MKIYRIFHKVDGYKAINIKGSNLETALINDRNDANLSQFNGTSYQWVGESYDIECDYPFIDGCIPVVSGNVLSIIYDLISSCSTITNISVAGKEYKIIEANTLPNALNEVQSKIRYFKDGRIMHIKKYAFNKNVQFPAIFRIPESKTFSFVTEDVMRILSDRGVITGICFEECELV